MRGCHASCLREQANTMVPGAPALRDIDGVCDTLIAYFREPSLQPWR
jgi:hypothetical protein